MFILPLKIPFVPGLKVKLKFHLGTRRAGMGFQSSLEIISLFVLFSATLDSSTFEAAKGEDSTAMAEQHAGVTAFLTHR